MKKVKKKSRGLKKRKYREPGNLVEVLLRKTGLTLDQALEKGYIKEVR